MPEPKGALVSLSIALLLPQVASAQIASRVQAGALVTSRDGEVPVSTMSVSPDVRIALPSLAIAARGSAWLAGQTWQIAEGALSATAISPTFHHLRLELLGDAARALSDRSIGDDQFGGQARLHAQFASRGGVWVGGGVARPWRIAVVSAVDVSGGGAWTRLGGATLSGTYTNFLFTKVLPATHDTGTVATCGSRSDPIPSASDAMRSGLPSQSAACRRYSHFSDLEGAVHWDLGVVELHGQTGYRFGSDYDVTRDSRHWAAMSATVWATERVAAVVGGGRIPANPARGLPARSYANFGLMLAYAPLPRMAVPVPSRTPALKSFELRPNPQGTQRLVVRIGSVESVDVMGDFSDWQPLTLVRRGRDLWELSVPMNAGIHQLNIRVDRGAWFVPPGLPTARDGFGGETGVLVVQ